MSVTTKEPSAKTEEGLLDRKLGDEWFDWTGAVDGEGGEIREGRRLYLLLSLATVAAVLAAALLLWFLISPRLSLIGPWLYHTVRVALFASVAVFLLGYGLTFGSVLLEKRIFLSHRTRQRFLNLLIPSAVRLGGWFGVSRDRVSNSFVKVSNSSARATEKRVGHGEILLLLPRCLAGDVRRVVSEMGRAHKCQIATASGGSVARLQIEKMEPLVIITMACERDLVSGILDVARDIPVLAIPNRRPKGPCKDTEVDPEEVREFIRRCLRTDLWHEDSEASHPDHGN